VILVTEDNPSFRSLLETTLAISGFSVCATADVPSALAIIQKERPNLLLTDLMLPDVSGFDLIRAVRENPLYADLPIIAMTAYDQHYLCQAIEVGADAVIHKEDLNPLPGLIEQFMTKE